MNRLTCSWMIFFCAMNSSEPAIGRVSKLSGYSPGSGKFILLVSLVAALGGLLFGYDTAIISGAVPFIRDYFKLNSFMLGWAISGILIGCGAGALLAGTLAEAWGRRTVLIVCAVLFAVSGLGAGTSSSLTLFISFRLAGGLGVGAAAMVSPMYIAEMAPAHQRGRLVSLYQLAIVSGILMAYLANYLLEGTGLNNWRYMFASQVIPALIFLLLLFFVPETPRWLVKKGRQAEALKILERTTGDQAHQALEEIISSFSRKERSGFTMLFSSRYLPVMSMGIFIAVFQQVTGINSVIYYAPLILKETGISTSGSLLQTMGIGLVNLLATFGAITMVDRVGRKRLLTWGSLWMGISLIALAACFYTRYFGHYLVLLSLLIYVASFSATWGAVAWVVLSEIFPNRIRGMAMSVATFALWLTDFIVTYTFPVLTASFGAASTFLCYALLCALSLVYVVRKVPETRGRSLEEIERSFSGNKLTE